MTVGKQTIEKLTELKVYIENIPLKKEGINIETFLKKSPEWPTSPSGEEGYWQMILIAEYFNTHLKTENKEPLDRKRYAEKFLEFYFKCLIFKEIGKLAHDIKETQYIKAIDKILTVHEKKKGHSVYFTNLIDIIQENIQGEKEDFFYLREVVELKFGEYIKGAPKNLSKGAKKTEIEEEKKAVTNYLGQYLDPQSGRENTRKFLSQVPELTYLSSCSNAIIQICNSEVQCDKALEENEEEVKVKERLIHLVTNQLCKEGSQAASELDSFQTQVESILSTKDGATDSYAPKKQELLNAINQIKTTSINTPADIAYLFQRIGSLSNGVIGAAQQVLDSQSFTNKEKSKKKLTQCLTFTNDAIKSLNNVIIEIGKGLVQAEASKRLPLEKTNNQLSQQLSEINSELAETQSSLQQWKVSHAQWQEDHGKLGEELIGITIKYNELEKTVEAQNQKLEAFSNQIPYLKSQNEEYKTKIIELQGTIESTKKELEKNKRPTKNDDPQLKKPQIETTSKITNLEKEKVELIESKEKLTKEIEELEKKIKGLLQSNESLQGDITRQQEIWQAQLEERDQALSELRNGPKEKMKEPVKEPSPGDEAPKEQTVFDKLQEIISTELSAAAVDEDTKKNLQGASTAVVLLEAQIKSHPENKNDYELPLNKFCDAYKNRKTDAPQFRTIAEESFNTIKKLGNSSMTFYAGKIIGGITGAVLGAVLGAACGLLVSTLFLGTDAGTSTLIGMGVGIAVGASLGVGFGHMFDNYRKKLKEASPNTQKNATATVLAEDLNKVFLPKSTM